MWSWRVAVAEYQRVVRGLRRCSVGCQLQGIAVLLNESGKEAEAPAYDMFVSPRSFSTSTTSLRGYSGVVPAFSYGNIVPRDVACMPVLPV